MELQPVGPCEPQRFLYRHCVVRLGVGVHEDQPRTQATSKAPRVKSSSSYLPTRSLADLTRVFFLVSELPAGKKTLSATITASASREEITRLGFPTRSDIQESSFYTSWLNHSDDMVRGVPSSPRFGSQPPITVLSELA